MFLYGRTFIFYGRSSDFPQSALPSRHDCQWRYTSRPFKGGLQLQVQFRTLTGFPCIEATFCRLIAIVRVQSYE